MRKRQFINVNYENCNNFGLNKRQRLYFSKGDFVHVEKKIQLNFLWYEKTSYTGKPVIKVGLVGMQS